MAQTEPHLFNEDALDLNNVTNTNLIPKIIGSKFFKIIFSFLLHNAFTTPSQRPGRMPWNLPDSDQSPKRACRPCEFAWLIPMPLHKC